MKNISLFFTFICSTAIAQTTTSTSTSKPTTSPLIATVSTTAPVRVPATARPIQPATRVAPQPVAVESTLSRMLRTTTPGGRELQPVSDPTPIDVTSGPGAVSPAAPTVKTLREGTYLVDRLG